MAKGGTRTTVTIAKADVGGFVGGAVTHPDVLDAVAVPLEARLGTTILDDFAVTHVGDGVALLLVSSETHAPKVADVVKEAYAAGARRAAELRLASAGTVHPVSASLTFEDRPVETLVFFVVDGGAAAGALDSVLALERGSLASAATTGPDPAAVVRVGAPFSRLAQILSPFARGVPCRDASGADRKLAPVGLEHARNPLMLPRVAALGFELAVGNLVGPLDIFDDPAFEPARRLAFTPVAP